MEDRAARHRPTILTISQRAGVAASTVSRALKGDPRISAERRAAILAIARAEGYAPNANARTLVTRRSGIVGFVMGDVHNPFYPEMLERLTARLTARGLRLMLLHVGSGPLEEDAIQALLQYQMDGCLISSAQLSSRAAEVCARYRVPMVMINRVARLHGCAVSCNNLAGARRLASLLVEAGHRRIGVVAGRAGTSTSEDRERGLVEALTERGLAVFARGEGHSTYDGGFAVARGFLAGGERPDAIFAVNDVMALGAIDALRREGLRVPRDVSVVGFDDIRAASWPAYDLTTIAQPVVAMIDRALDLLIARIAAPALPDEEDYIAGELKLRGSARLPSRPASGSSQPGAPNQ